VCREVNLYVNDATVYNVMERLRDLGGIAAVHTENADIVDYCTARLLAAGQRTPVHYPQSRPTFTEVECIRRVLFLARSARAAVYVRSEEHTSELQSRGHLVCRLLLEKKKQKQHAYLQPIQLSYQ